MSYYFYKAVHWKLSIIVISTVKYDNVFSLQTFQLGRESCQVQVTIQMLNNQGLQVLLLVIIIVVCMACWSPVSCCALWRNLSSVLWGKVDWNFQSLTDTFSLQRNVIVNSVSLLSRCISSKLIGPLNIQLSLLPLNASFEILIQFFSVG